MKVSINLMKRFTDAAQWKLPVPKLVQKIGAQLGAVEETIDLSGKWDGVFVADIVAAREHPSADKLGIYQLNVGTETLQVIAGDKSLNVGDKVGWMKPGATVPASWGTAEPFVLGAREMRGEVSNGMMGSGKELCVNDDHSRVQVLDTDAPAGTPFAEAYNLAGDAIIDIENKMFTHRPDGFGHLGVAREIAGIQNLPFTSPDWYSLDAELPKPEADLPLAVTNEVPALVPRYTAIVLDGVKVAPSPLWLQACLRTVGIRPINNIVDLTNYMMVVTGQPLHAFDYDKVEGHTIAVRAPKPGETLTLLDGKTIEPSKDAMLICDAKKPIALGGMMGGANSEIDQNTTRIVLESATFQMYAIRRASMHHGIFTDAVTRFSKGQSPLQTVAVAAKAIQEIQAVAGGRVGAAIDDNHLPKGMLQRGSVHAPVVVSAEFINGRLGSQLDAPAIATLLRNVECRVEEHGDELIVTPPFWRTDIEIPEDVVEEVGRMRGYDTLPHALPTRDTVAVDMPALDTLKDRLRDILSRAGASELQTYSFVPTRLLQTVGQSPERAFSIRNALSPDLQHYRLSLTPSLLEKVHPNIKAGYKQFGLFEVNKIHIKDDVAVDCDGLPREYQTVAFVYASDQSQPGAAYYRAKHYLDSLMGGIGIDYHVVPATIAPGFEVGRQVFAPFEPKRAAYVYVGESFVGFVGEYRRAVAKGLKLPEVTAGFELDIERLLQHQKPRRYQPIIKFPATEQDVCLKVDAAVTYADLHALVAEAFVSDERLRLRVDPLDIYQRPDDPAHKQITFRITLQHHDRTLTTSEVNDMLDTMVQKVDAAIGAERV